MKIWFHRKVCTFFAILGSMKKFWIIFFVLGFSGFLFSQEIEDQRHSIPAENKAVEEETPLFEVMDGMYAPQMGPFQIDRYKLHFNLLDISFPSEEKNVALDIMAIARAEEFKRKSRIRDFKPPVRQLEQIRSQVQVFVHPTIWQRSSERQFESRLTPDGGIRNEAYRDMRQPFINPYPVYYDRYYRPSTFDYYYGRPTNLYYYRR